MCVCVCVCTSYISLMKINENNECFMFYVTQAVSPLSTHILDTTVGKPAANVSITVFKVASGLWTKVDNW